MESGGRGPEGSPPDAGARAGGPAPGHPQQGGDDPHHRSARLERLGEQAEDFVDSVEAVIGSAVPGNVRSRRHPRQNTVINVVWRALVLLAGLGLILLGIAMLVLPGPGWGMILLGLVILATEYTWANRLVEPVRRRVKTGAQRVNRLPRPWRIAAYTATAATSAAFIAVGVWFMARGDFSWPPW